jgi:hypothetical protein
MLDKVSTITIISISSFIVVVLVYLLIRYYRLRKRDLDRKVTDIGKIEDKLKLPRINMNVQSTIGKFQSTTSKVMYSNNEMRNNPANHISNHKSIIAKQKSSDSKLQKKISKLLGFNPILPSNLNDSEVNALNNVSPPENNTKVIIIPKMNCIQNIIKFKENSIVSFNQKSRNNLDIVEIS